MTDKTPNAYGNEVGGKRHTSEPSAEDLQSTMFYDGGCPLCSREVAHYRRLDRRGRIKWVDIHANPDAVDTIGVDYTQAMARLHVLDRSGRVQTGVNAFVAIWDELPGYRFLARILRALHLVSALDSVYTHFARWRHKRRQCEAGACARS